MSLLEFDQVPEPEKASRPEAKVEAKPEAGYAAKLEALESAVIKRELSQLPEDATGSEKDIIIEEAMRLAEVEGVVRFYDALAAFEKESVAPKEQEGKYQAIGFVEEKLSKMGNIDLWLDQAAKAIPDAVPHIIRILDLALAAEVEGPPKN